MREEDLKKLFDYGLMFEINRSILHPLGYTLVFKESRNPDEQNSFVLMKTSDDEGCLFTEQNFMDGAARFSIFMKNMGEKAVQKRMEKLGFIRQTRSDQ